MNNGLVQGSELGGAHTLGWGLQNGMWRDMETRNSLNLMGSSMNSCCQAHPRPAGSSPSKSSTISSSLNLVNTPKSSHKIGFLVEKSGVKVKGTENEFRNKGNDAPHVAPRTDLVLRFPGGQADWENRAVSW